MNPRTIILKTVQQSVYVSANGKETPVPDMAPTHLVNAFAKAVFDDNELVVDVLKREILTRLTAPTP